MTAVEMEVENGARQAMDTEDVDSSGSSSDASGEEVESGREAMEGSDEENEESHANPAFSKFMQGFWDLASVDVPVRYVAATLLLLNPSDSSGTLAKCMYLVCNAIKLLSLLLLLLPPLRLPMPPVPAAWAVCAFTRMSMLGSVVMRATCGLRYEHQHDKRHLQLRSTQLHLSPTPQVRAVCTRRQRFPSQLYPGLCSPTTLFVSRPQPATSIK